MIHTWPAYSLQYPSISHVAVKVNYNNFCTYDDILIVLAIRDASGNILWSNYILLIKDGVTYADPGAQVELRKAAFCSNYSPTAIGQDPSMEFAYPASADKQF